MQSAIQIKRDKNNFICIQCADKEHFKTRPKQSLAYSIKVWYAKLIQRSSNAIIFAVI